MHPSSYTPEYQRTYPSFGRLSDMLSFGYVAQTFGPIPAKRHICHNLLGYTEDQDDLVVNLELLRPDYSYPGLPGTFSVPHTLYSHLRCNAIAADGTSRIILDYGIQNLHTRVVEQGLFAPYAGLPRSQAELQNAQLLSPIFFIRADHTVGLTLELAKSVDAHGQVLLYNNWKPMEGKASIKLRICWLGYTPWQTQIQLRNRRKEPITLPRLVQLVASGVDRFLRYEHGQVTDHSYPEWVIGQGHHGISASDVELVGVMAVSMGSIMPIMRLAHRGLPLALS
ncbi:hypothetical protein BC834DRAFT_348909 [Gloeopeniophorella convolvens]|nr:hypothetical protein BC834DRAFT_348909 [Gloeopeniophorella convolvens]